MFPRSFPLTISGPWLIDGFSFRGPLPPPLCFLLLFSSFPRNRYYSFFSPFYPFSSHRFPRPFQSVDGISFETRVRICLPFIGVYRVHVLFLFIYVLHNLVCFALSKRELSCCCVSVFDTALILGVFSRHACATWCCQAQTAIPVCFTLFEWEPFSRFLSNSLLVAKMLQHNPFAISWFHSFFLRDRLSQTVLHSCVDKLGALILRRPSGSSCDLCSLVTTGVTFFCQYWSFCCLFMHDLLNVSWMNKNSKLWASISSDCHGLFWFSI